jgi:hypothetical protein
MDLPLYRPAIEKLNAITASAAQINESATMSSAFLGGGTAYFVDSVNGVNAHDGLSWTTAKLTIANAVSTCAAGDTIFIKGTTFSEAVTNTKAGVRFIGCGTGPSQATWTAPTVQSSFCLKTTGAGVLIENIKFKPVIYVTGVATGPPSGVRIGVGSDYTIIRGCRFQGQVGSYKAIYADGNCSNIVIEGNEFLYMNTATNGAAIYSANLAGAWVIKNNIFNSNLRDIQIIGRWCILDGNIHPVVGLKADGSIGVVTSVAVDLSGTDGQANTMTRCVLGGTYNQATYVVSTGGNDLWRGNFASIVATTAPNGLTVLVPAA